MTRTLAAALVCLAALSPSFADAATPDHPVGTGLDGISYYMSYSPFNDVTKTMRWIDVAEWDEKGYPAAANEGKTVMGRAGVDRGDTLPNGDYVLTWRGEGEVTLDRPREAELVSDETADGVHRRVYRVSDVGDAGLIVKVPSFPVTDLHLWIPGGEQAEGMWNRDYLAAIEPFRGTHLRFMDLNATNHSEQKEWSDRTPVAWASYIPDNMQNSAPMPVKGRVPYEAMIELCNAMDTDFWVTVPHMATDEYVANLAHLIHTGVDRATGEQTTEPLKDGLKVWIEYSNEVWNWNFKQTKWADTNLPGEKLDDKYTLKSVELFKAFEEEFGGTDRLVRVIATQTGYGKGWRTQQRLAAAEPGRDFDVLAVTTYFSHDMEEWALEHWPVTPEAFMDELESRLGSGPLREDEPLEDNSTPAFSYAYAAEAGVPVVSYEGNSHLIASRRVVPPDPEMDAKGNPKKVAIYSFMPEFTDFLHTVERTERFVGLYEKWLERHEASGLVTNTPFVLVSGWSRNGQWGHMQYLGQPLDEAVKYKMLLEHYGLPKPGAAPTDEPQ